MFCFMELVSCVVHASINVTKIYFVNILSSVIYECKTELILEIIKFSIRQHLVIILKVMFNACFESFDQSDSLLPWQPCIVIN